MNKSKVSIIMPAYNAEKNIMQSITSILEQTYTNFELIVINDSSNDKTLKIIKDIEDDRVHIIDLKENGGVANARNQGIKYATGEFLAFLDSDDLWVKDKLDTQITFMKENKYSFTFTDYFVIGSKSRISGKEKSRKFSKKVSFSKLKRSNQIGCLTVVIETDIIKKYLMPSIRHEDYATWLTILRDEKILAYNVGKPLSRYRVHKDSLSGDKLKSSLWQWSIYRDYLRLSYIESVFNFINYFLSGIRKRI